jgi:hypothetical protein
MSQIATRKKQLPLRSKARVNYRAFQIGMGFIPAWMIPSREQVSQ